MRAEISGYVQQLRFEVTRKDFNTAALQCEMHLSAHLENQVQVVKSRAELLAGVLYWMGMQPVYLLRLSNLFSSSFFVCLKRDFLWDLVIAVLYSGFSLRECCFCLGVFTVPNNTI